MSGPTQRTSPTPQPRRPPGGSRWPDAGPERGWGPPWARPGWDGARWDGAGWDGPGGWAPRRPPLVALAVVLAVIQLVGTLAAAHAQPERRSLDLLGVALLLAGPVAVALLTRAGVVAATVVVGLTTGAYLVL